MTNNYSSKLNTQHFQPPLLKDRNSLAKNTRRGHLDITAEILMFCDQPKTKTSIMYNTNLNYTHLKRQINLLTTQKLLAKKTSKYTTTEKGNEFLNLFLRLHNLVDDYTP